MNELKNFFLENSQISAALITALCGILGVFVNIIINIQFRNRDYKNKNRIRQIENLEKYYLPLTEKTRNLMECIESITIRQNMDLFKILNGELGANYAGRIRIIIDVIDELYILVNEELYKIVGNYRLLQIHRKVRKKIWILRNYVKVHIKTCNELMSEVVVAELRELNYRISKYEIKLMINFFILRHIEYAKLWFDYRKK